VKCVSEQNVVQIEALRKMKHILSPMYVSISLLVFELEGNSGPELLFCFWRVTKNIGSEVVLNKIILMLFCLPQYDLMY
jgi:hypothetical protein